MSTKTHWFLERSHTLSQCEIIKSSPQKREIHLVGSNKNLAVHPEGVAWGRLFPRVFTVEGNKAPDITVLHDRVLARQNLLTEACQNAVPREISGYRFQPFIKDVIDSVIQGQNVILTGGTGVGKTTHITQLAHQANQPLLRINFNGETRMSDLVGKVQVVGGETRWVDGVLPTAMRNGWWLLLDELDFAEPAVLSLLHPVLEEEPMLVIKENQGEILRPKAGFRIFATANSIGAMSNRAQSYHGTTEMNEAFLDRWQVIMVDNLSVDEEVKVIRKAAPGLRTVWARRMAEFASKARSGEVSGYASDNFSTRKVLAWAKKTELHRDPMRGAELAWLDKIAKDEQEPIRRALHAVFGSGKRTGLGRAKAKTKAGGVTSVSTTSTGKRRGRPPRSATV